MVFDFVCVKNIGEKVTFLIKKPLVTGWIWLSELCPLIYLLEVEPNIGQRKKNNDFKNVKPTESISSRKVSQLWMEMKTWLFKWRLLFVIKEDTKIVWKKLTPPSSSCDQWVIVYTIFRFWKILLLKNFSGQLPEFQKK